MVRAVSGPGEPDQSGAEHAGRPIPLLVAGIPVLALIGLLALFILVLPRTHPGFEGTGHLPLLMAAAVAGITARIYGHPWREIEAGVVRGIELALAAVLILLSIGILMGTWLAGGVVPALIDWGLSLLHPVYFLPTTCAVCSIVSLVSGSSWSTAGTVGLALIGIGGAMGIDPAMTAGAVVSGAYFGDKLSPMSDTTNLAPAVAGTELFTHIRHQVLTTGPAWGIAMIGYTWLSLGMSEAADPGEVAGIQATIRASFDPGLVHLLPPVIVVGLVMRRLPALPTLLLGGLLGAVVAVAVEGAALPDVAEAAMNGYRADTGDAAVDELLSRGGMTSMSSTVLLILCAMSFGGVMERTGMLEVLAARVLAWARSTGSLIAVTVLTSAGINVVAADQYIAVVVPGRMYARAYAQRGLHAKNLSRAIEDGGTITSPLVPWNTCGAFMSGTLLVATTAYLPYAFLNLVNPLISILYGFTGWFIAPAEPPAETGPPNDDGSAGPP
jgi:Na+:H+ antiporter, NhaC family